MGRHSREAQAATTGCGKTRDGHGRAGLSEKSVPFGKKVRPRPSPSPSPRVPCSRACPRTNGRGGTCGPGPCCCTWTRWASRPCSASGACGSASCFGVAWGCAMVVWLFLRAGALRVGCVSVSLVSSSIRLLVLIRSEPLQGGPSRIHFFLLHFIRCIVH